MTAVEGDKLAASARAQPRQISDAKTDPIGGIYACIGKQQDRLKTVPRIVGPTDRTHLSHDSDSFRMSRDIPRKVTGSGNKAKLRGSPKKPPKEQSISQWLLLT